MRERFAALGKGLKDTLSAAGDLIVLNVLYILCCIPVLTVGAAEAACYSGLIRLLRKKNEGLPFRPFFREFASSLKQTLPAWLLQLACLAVLAGDIWFATVYSEPDNKFFLIFAIVLGVVLLLAGTWLYPLMARFRNTLAVHLKNAFLMAFARFPATLLALLIRAAVIAIPILFFDAFVYFGWFWLLFGFSLPMYAVVKLFQKQLHITPDADSEENGQD